ncbi:alpha/beta hydrolase, partial [Dietzia sp. DQ12-76]|nr:alpha/beta hydrolase [Dietzia sp. DQ12-76]
MSSRRSPHSGAPYDGGLMLPHATRTGAVPVDGRRSAAPEADRP